MVISKGATMSSEGTDFSEMLVNHMEDSVKPEGLPFTANHENNRYSVKANGTSDGSPFHSKIHDKLVQMVVELNFQNEYLKSEFEDLNDHQLEARELVYKGDSASGDVKILHEKIESLNRELSEEKLTRGAAEKALKHLQNAYTEADAKAHELSANLAEAQQKMDKDLKERDEKYSELDSKFSRLHKRAKQRIQDVQKEKEDLEIQLREVIVKAQEGSLQQSQLQQELERTRQQANDALKAIDADRQQLRVANNKLRDDIEELRGLLQHKDNAIEGLQQSILERDQMVEDMRGQLEDADDKKQASIAELSAKHHKQLENLEAQLADALSDRSKATETISSLQVLVAEKESKIAEMDAASSGEAARLRASVETVKGELVHLKNEHEKQKECWEAASQALKVKLEIAESNCMRAEIEAAKMRSQLEFDLSMQAQLLNTRDAELLTAKEEINHLESEFSSYKVRAHALLQRKDAELAAAKESEQLLALEEALKEAEKEILLASAEKDRALDDLQDALANNDKELAARDAALRRAEQQIKSLESKLDSANDRFLSEKEALNKNLENQEETWRLRYEALKAEKEEVSSSQDIQQEYEELKLQYKRLKDEHDSFRDLADRMIEEKDGEISKLVDNNKNLHRSLELRSPADHSDEYYTDTAFRKQDSPTSSTSAAEQQILILARQQAQREEELAQSQRHILALQEEIEELERENRLHSQQETMLKDELRNMERMQRREGVDMTYLKNVILKLLETGEVGALLPVVGMLLQFSPEEMQKCHQAYHNSTDVPPPSPANDTSGSGLSLLSRFSFS